MITPSRLAEIRHIAPTAGLLGQAAINELLAEVERMRTVPPNLRIEGTWLVEDVGRHTCGGWDSIGHERDCGLVPLVDLADLPGWGADHA